MEEKSTGADALLDVFESYGVEQIFCSPGSEWPTAWEALAKRRAKGNEKPYYVNCRHEEVAVSAAIAYERLTGKVPGILLHTTVGLLKGSMAIRSAFKSQVPMIILSGGSMNYGEGKISVGQQFLNLADVGSPRRFAEAFTKWAGEAYSTESLAGVLNHACELAIAPPKGPTFVYAPFEVLLQEVAVGLPTKDKTNLRFDFAPDPDLVKQVSQLLANSHSPLIVTEYAGNDQKAVGALVELAEALAIPVVEAQSRVMNFPRGHPLHVGFAPKPYLNDADLVLLVGTSNPWYPGSSGPSNPKAKVVLIDDDPGKSRIPYWNFGAEIAITGSMERTLRELAKAVRLESQSSPNLDRSVRERFANTKVKHEQFQGKSEKMAQDASSERPIEAYWAAHVLSKVLPQDSIVIVEATSQRSALDRMLMRSQPGTFFSAATGGGLGMGFGFALGAKLAAKEKLVVAVIGDGALNYNPFLPALGFIQENNTPILIVVFDNGGYSSQHSGVLRNFPDGYAVKTGVFYGTSITPHPNYAGLVEASGGYGEKVEDPIALESALRRAIEKVDDGHLALVDVIMKFEDPAFYNAMK